MVIVLWLHRLYVEYVVRIQLASANQCVEMKVGQVCPASPLRVPIVVTQAAVLGVGADQGCGVYLLPSPRGDGVQVAVLVSGALFCWVGL